MELSRFYHSISRCRRPPIDGIAQRRRRSFWCEITVRTDIGADLHCPQADKRGAPYWSYALIREIWSGDIVLPRAHPLLGFCRQEGGIVCSPTSSLQLST